MEVTKTGWMVGAGNDKCEFCGQPLSYRDGRGFCRRCQLNTRTKYRGVKSHVHRVENRAPKR
jgi:uncharacterized Zn finger protein (UPF0148 family)